MSNENQWFANVGARRRYEIPEIGGWIELRQELSVGEERKMYAGVVKGQVDTPDGPRTEYDMAKLSFSQVVAYLVDWSSKLDVSPETIEGLKPSIYHPIEEAVLAHVKELDKANPRPRQKDRKGRNRAPKTGDAPTLTSVA